MKRLIFILFFLGFITASIEAQNSLTIRVTGIDNPSGKLYVALFDSKVPFLSSRAKGEIVAINKNDTDVVFDNLENGYYAVTLFQDENNNGKLDLGDYGIPIEKYGFSNNIDPSIISRPPTFDECKFEVNGDTTIVIKAVSAIK